MKGIIYILLILIAVFSFMTAWEFRKEKHIKRHFGRTGRYSVAYASLSVLSILSVIVLINF